MNFFFLSPKRGESIVELKLLKRTNYKITNHKLLKLLDHPLGHLIGAKKNQSQNNKERSFVILCQMIGIFKNIKLEGNKLISIVIIEVFWPLCRPDKQENQNLPLNLGYLKTDPDFQ